jgi:hypothetical protein
MANEATARARVTRPRQTSAGRMALFNSLIFCSGFALGVSPD